MSDVVGDSFGDYNSRMPSEEKREFQRLDLREPMRGSLDGSPVDIVDLGILGARIESDALPSKESCTLILAANGVDISLQCEVVHRFDFTSTRRQGAGLAFTSAATGSDTSLRELLTKLVREQLAALPTGAVISPAFDAEQTAMRIPAPFTSHRLGEHGWSKRAAFLAHQPENGFTLPAAIPTAEVHRLRQEFEQAGEEARKLIRLFAELRVSEVLHLPPTH